MRDSDPTTKSRNFLPYALITAGIGGLAFVGFQQISNQPDNLSNEYDIESYIDDSEQLATIEPGPTPTERPAITISPETSTQEQEPKKTEAEKRRESLNIQPSPIVSVKIPKLDYNYPVEAYSLVDNISGDTIKYSPIGMMTVNAINDSLGINTDDNKDDAEQIYGPLGIKNGELINLLKLFGHNNNTGPGAFDRLQELKDGDKVFVSTENGVIYTFEVSFCKKLSKEDVNSLETVVGDGGHLFSCFTSVDDNGNVLRTDDYRVCALDLIGVQKPDDNKTILMK